MRYPCVIIKNYEWGKYKQLRMMTIICRKPSWNDISLTAGGLHMTPRRTRVRWCSLLHICKWHIFNIPLRLKCAFWYSWHIEYKNTRSLANTPWHCGWCGLSQGWPVHPGDQGWTTSAVVQLSWSSEPCLWATTWWRAGGWPSRTQVITPPPKQRQQLVQCLYLYEIL